MRIPSYDDLTRPIPDVSPGEVFKAVARFLPTVNSQPPTSNSQISQNNIGSWELGVGTLFACLRSARMPEAIDRIARDFSPRIQRYGADAVVLDVSGLGRLLGSPQMIGDELARHASALPYSDVRVAIAPTQTAALLLTLSDGGLTVVTADEFAALAPLPLQRLQQHVAALLGTTIFGRDRATPADDDFAVLRRWGLKTLGEFAALPASDLSARMGQRGLALQRLARGVDPGPLVPDPGVPRFIERMELEWPIDALEPLSFVLARLLEPLSSALERAGRAAAAVHLQLRLVDRTTHERVLQLPAAIRDSRVLRTLLLLDLESHAPPAAVDVVIVEVDPAPGRVIQYSLLERALPSAETLATLMARLGALVGESRCGSPHLPDTHRPDAFEMIRFNPTANAQRRTPNAERPAPAFAQEQNALRRGKPSIRRFRPPVAVRVTVERGRPAHLAIDRRGMPGGHIVQAAGPWRWSGAWWDVERTPWDRDEWDVELADGGLCRLFHDRRTSVWFLDGIFD
jgi:protein ImuB